MLKWIRRGVIGAALLFLVLMVTAWGLMRGSLPQLSGEIRLPGLQAPLSITRDERGTVLIQGGSRADVALGLGLVHAQERFFEMDLARLAYSILARRTSSTRRCRRLSSGVRIFCLQGMHAGMPSCSRNPARNARCGISPTAGSDSRSGWWSR